MIRELNKLKKEWRRTQRGAHLSKDTKVVATDYTTAFNFNKYLPQYNKSCPNVQEIQTTLSTCFPFVIFCSVDVIKRVCFQARIQDFEMGGEFL